MKLETFQLDDFCWQGSYWQLTVKAEPSIDYGGEDRSPVVREILSQGEQLGPLPMRYLPRDFVEAVQDAVTEIWRHPIEEEFEYDN